MIKSELQSKRTLNRSGSYGPDLAPPMTEVMGVHEVTA